MGTLHGDIKVSNIFMDKHRNVKLMDSYFLKQGKTSYEVVLEDPVSMSLLAPEQLDLLKIKLFDTLSLNAHKEIFTVGMSMIEATTIQ
jgi:serine/threonine protein kinase